MPIYPAQIDTNTTLPQVTDNFTPVMGSVYNRLRDAVIAIETELGVNPKSVYTTVRARLDIMEGLIGSLHSIELTGDLGGTYSHPLVIGLQGYPVSSAAPTKNYVLTWNGLAWQPSVPAGPEGPAGPAGPTGPTGPAGSSSTHNELPGLQGGNSTDGYYHLTSYEHAWLIDGYSTNYWSVDKGGTGIISYSIGDILYANGTTSLNRLPIGIDGYHLTVQSGIPAWTYLEPVITAHNLTSGIQGGSLADGYYHLTSQEHAWLTDGYNDGYWIQSKGGTNQTSYSQGDILYANNDGVLSKLPKSFDGYVLTLSSNLPSWLPALGSSGFSNVLYVDLNGNDGTAERGNSSLPYASIQTALNAAQSGDIVFVGPGTWNELIVWPEISELALVGSGRNETIIDMPNSGGDYTFGIIPVTTPIAKCVISNIKIYDSGAGFAIGVNGSTQLISNIILNNIHCFTDSSYGSEFETIQNLKISNCLFDTLYIRAVVQGEVLSTVCEEGTYVKWLPSDTVTWGNASNESRFIGCTLNGLQVLDQGRAISVGCKIGGTTVTLTDDLGVQGYFDATGCSINGITISATGVVTDVATSINNCNISTISAIRSSGSSRVTVKANNSAIEGGIGAGDGCDVYVLESTFNHSLIVEVGSGNVIGSEHNNMFGLQGGTGVDGYYHLTAQEHTWLTDGYNDGYWTEAKGGTGNTTYAFGDILYGSASPNKLAKLPLENDGYVLASSGAGPFWNYVYPSNYLYTFTSANVDGLGIITISHNLNSKYVIVEIYDENDEKIVPDAVTLIDVNSVSVDINSYGVISGTWHAIVFIGGSIPSSRSVNRWFLAGGSENTSSTGWVTIGAAYIDPTNGSPNANLRVILETSNALYSCYARLYNADDVIAVGGEIIEDSIVPTLNTLPLVAGVTTGFPYVAKTYWLQIKMNGGSAPNFVSCKGAVVEQI